MLGVDVRRQGYKEVSFSGSTHPGLASVILPLFWSQQPISWNSTSRVGNTRFRRSSSHLMGEPLGLGPPKEGNKWSSTFQLSMGTVGGHGGSWHKPITGKQEKRHLRKNFGTLCVKNSSIRNNKTKQLITYE